MFIIEVLSDSEGDFILAAVPGHCVLTCDRRQAMAFETRDEAADVADQIEIERHDLDLAITAY